MSVMDDGLGQLTLGEGPVDYTGEQGELADFGPLKLPANPGMKARVEVDRTTSRIGAVSVRVASTVVQLQLVAAAPGTDYWSDLRRAIIANIHQRGGHHTVIEGHFGPEVVATLPGRRVDGSAGEGTVRIIGVQGSRWVLRATVTGESVADDAVVGRVNAFISGCVIDRGSEAAASGTVLALAAPLGDVDHGL